jgi:hemolysin III
LVALAGVLYTVGAILFGRKMPKPHADWFGYHEYWHVIGVTAGALLFIVNFGLIAGNPL